MSKKKWGVLVAAGVLAAALALVGCSSSSTSSASSSSAASASGSASAQAEMKLIKDGTLTIATSPDFPPFENIENGDLVGLDIEIGKAVANKLGLEPEFVQLQFDNILTAVAGGKQADVGISGFTVEPERQKTVDFSDSYYTDDLAIAGRRRHRRSVRHVGRDLRSGELPQRHLPALRQLHRCVCRYAGRSG